MKEKKDNNNIWLTSDSHFFHQNIIKYSCRPFKDVHEMNKALIENWNHRVNPEDTVWHLGDFAFCSIDQLKNLLSRLNGNINVVLGNHDKVIIKNRSMLLDVGLLNSVQNYAEINYKKHKFVLFHYGQRVWNKSHYGSFHLYGHSHGTLPPYGRSFDVGVDSTVITTEYRPLSIEEVTSHLENIPILSKK